MTLGDRLDTTDRKIKLHRPQEADFLANGFCVILDTLPGAMLARAQAAWLRRELPARRAFEEDQMLAPVISAEARLNAESLKPQQLLNAAGEQVRRADGTAVSHGAYRTFFDCDALAEEDDVFVELVDNPKTSPLLARVCGNGGLGEGESQHAGSFGTVRFSGMSGRIVPQHGNGEGYTVWHRDLPAPCDSWPRPFQRYIKSFTYIWGSELDGGEGALVPGSHRLPHGPDGHGPYDS